jgi:2-methylcitrate dehydratase PrpD
VLIDAKFSIPFCTALALVRGRVDLDSFTAEALADRQVLALAAKVEALVAEVPGRQRGSGGAIAVRLADGRVLSAEVANVMGCPERPLDEAALVAKFIDCAGRAEVPPADAAALAGRILALEECADVGAVFG